MAAARHSSSDLPLFRILGPLDVRLGGQPATPAPPLLRSLLALLLLRGGEPCSRAWLTEALWGRHQPSDPASSVRTSIHGLRVMPAGLAARLQTQPEGYLFKAAEGEVDLQLFRDLYGRGRAAWDRSEPDTAGRLLGEALQLWREPPLADLPDTPIVTAEKGHLLSLRASARETWLDTQLELGRHRHIVPQIRALIAAEPLREHARAQLILALYRSGDTLGAKEAYRQARAVMAEEFGASPGPELTAIHRGILAGTKALLAGPAFSRPRRV
jgi:DNA-binding SARP family transcriptional activator